MSVNSKMTALADEVRELSGTTAKLGIDAMTTNVQSANTEVSDQTDLIAQISAALDGKAGGSGSGSSANVDTCTVTLNAYCVRFIRFTTYDGENFIENTSAGTFTDDTDTYAVYGGIIEGSKPAWTTVKSLKNVVCGSTVDVLMALDATNTSLMENVELLEGSGLKVAHSTDPYNNPLRWFRCKITAPAGGRATIYIYDVD